MLIKRIRRRIRLKRLLPLALALLLSVAFLSVHAARQREKEVFVRYTLTLTLASEEADALSVGDSPVDARTKEAAGEILDVRREVALTETHLGVCEKTGYTRLVLTLGVMAEEDGEGYHIGSTRIRPGERVCLHGRAAVEGLCLTAEAAVAW